MQYISTRGGCEAVTPARAITLGMAPDGGLFVPIEQPGTIDPGSTVADSYQELAVKVISPFLDDFQADELENYVRAAYNTKRFDTADIAPLRPAGEYLFYLELWHGPTAAFKDLALQLLPYLLKGAAKKCGTDEEIVILVATSGDTGKAALEGFRDVPGTHVIVFFPHAGVSDIQKQQMITQEGNNVHVVAVRGNFDDTQSGVKTIFADEKFRKQLAGRGYSFSSANSINWGRLVPQIVYYFSAYRDLIGAGVITAGEAVNFVVPTGNFGNILAGYYARRMGLPVKRLICAANRNRVLTDFIATGCYNKNRPFYRTTSPSMDILVSSNLERLLFELTGGDADRIRRWMADLQDSGVFTVDQNTARAVSALFWSDYASDQEAAAAIRRIFCERGYPLDPHTAVGQVVYEKFLEGTGDRTKTVLASTASPFKFNRTVCRALFDREEIEGLSEYALLNRLAEKSGLNIPAGLKDLDKKPVLHSTVVDKHEIKAAVLRLLQ